MNIRLYSAGVLLLLACLTRPALAENIPQWWLNASVALNPEEPPSQYKMAVQWPRYLFELYPDNWRLVYVEPGRRDPRLKYYDFNTRGFWQEKGRMLVGAQVGILTPRIAALQLEENSGSLVFGFNSYGKQLLTMKPTKLGAGIFFSESALELGQFMRQDGLVSIGGKLYIREQYQGRLFGVEESAPDINVFLPANQSSYWLNDAVVKKIDNNQELLALAGQFEDYIRLIQLPAGTPVRTIKLESPADRLLLSGSELFASLQLSNEIQIFNLSAESDGQEPQVITLPDSDTAHHLAGISMALSPDEQLLAVSLYYSNKVILFTRHQGQWQQQQVLDSAMDSYNRTTRFSYPEGIRFVADDQHLALTALVQNPVTESNYQTLLMLTQTPDFPPVFSREHYSIYAPEQLAYREMVGQVDINDPEGFPVDMIFNVGDVSGWPVEFGWDSKNRTILAGSGWVYPEGTSWQLNLTASDRTGLTSQATAVITIGDPPVSSESVPYTLITASASGGLVAVCLVVAVPSLLMFRYCRNKSH